jgi:hypothetical protein
MKRVLAVLSLLLPLLATDRAPEPRQQQCDRLARSTRDAMQIAVGSAAPGGSAKIMHSIGIRSQVINNQGRGKPACEIDCGYTCEVVIDVPIK